MRKITSSIVVLLAVLVFGLMLSLPNVKADYDHVDEPGATDCIDALIPVPPPTARQFGGKGGTDKLRLVYNITEILKLCKNYELRIAALEKEIVKLRAMAKTVLNIKESAAKIDSWFDDPNEVP
jgi:hypothetical protein